MKTVINFFAPDRFAGHKSIGTIAAVSALIFLQAAHGAAGATTYNLQVPITAPWFDTQIDVSSGDRLLIAASGSVQYWDVGPTFGGPGGTNWDGTQFFANAICPDATVVSLIGKTGGTTTVGTGTPVPEGMPGNGIGYVGAAYNQIILSGGRLFLGFNDQVIGFYDNIGSFDVSVSVTPIPEPATIALLGLGTVLLGWRLGREKRLARRLAGLQSIHA